MTDLTNLIIREIETPGEKDLQERLLQAMFLLERYRGIAAVGIECVPDVLDADFSSPAIERLAIALERFIRGCPEHPDVGSAIWALGKLRDPRHTDLFASVTDVGNSYSEWARAQAVCAIEDLR